LDQQRVESTSYGLKTPERLKIEDKSSAYMQTRNRVSTKNMAGFFIGKEQNWNGGTGQFLDKVGVLLIYKYSLYMKKKIENHLIHWIWKKGYSMYSAYREIGRSKNYATVVTDKY
jgi:hypothetical protein